jgi:fibronectin-binding autotransporter adhesin
MGGGVGSRGTGKSKFPQGVVLRSLKGLDPIFGFHVRNFGKPTLLLGASVSAVAIVAGGVVLGAVPALADGGAGRQATIGVGAGGLGGVDGSLADATGRDATTSGSAFSGGGGGGVDLTTGNGGAGGASSVNTAVGSPDGTAGTTGTMGSSVTTATTISTAISGGAGGTGQTGNSARMAGGHGGGGVGVSATADVTVTGTGEVTGGAGAGGTGPTLSGGGGGGGVGIFSNANVTVQANGQVTGGAGGRGFGSGGGGGAAAVVLTGSSTISNSGTLTGGAGGSASANSGGGNGGAGVQILNGGTIINEVGGSITGGAGGLGTLNTTTNPTTSSGNGGAGIKGSGVTVVNKGTITGGSSGGVGGNDGNAVEFTGGSNRLEIWSGSSIVGNIVAGGTDDTFALGGTTSDSFDVSRFDAGGQYDGFEHYDKAGAGTWTLTGTTSKETAWILTDGTLSISSDANLGASTGSLTFDGGTLQVTGASVASTRDMIFNSDGTIDVTSGASLTAGGSLSGAGGLIKTGAGTLDLTGTVGNSYSGGTTIQGGMLSISSDANLGSTTGALTFDGGTLHTTADMTSSRAVNLNSAGTISTDDGTTLTLNGTMTGAGGLTKSGDGTLRLDGTGSYAGGTTINAGVLSVNGDYSGVTGTNLVADGGTLKGIGILGGDLTLAANGTIAPGNSIGTLTISGNYTGNAGTLEIESELGNDASPSDRLVVTGNTAGTTNVKVINVGGAGAPTVEGIKVVDVGGISSGTFTLQGDYVFQGDQAVVGGAYAYRLYKNGVSTPTDGDWYLRSTLINPDSSPGTPADPTTPSAPLYQPGVPLYEAYAQLLLDANTLPTLQQRVGNRQWSNDGEGAPGTAAEGAWIRTEGMHSRVEPDSSTSATSYDYDFWKLQAGADGELYSNGNGTLVGGLTAHYDRLSGNIHSFYGNGDVDTNGYGGGATLTWYGNDGFYADAQGQLTWYDSDLKSDLAGTMANGNSGFGYALSLEAGKRFATSGPWSITPQAQVIYSSVDFDSFDDRFGARVSSGDGDSLIGRLGVALDREESWQRADGQAARAKFYGVANLYGEAVDGTTVDVSGVGFKSKNDPVWGGLTLGTSYDWNGDRFSLYGEVAAKSSLKDFGDSYALSGTAGFRVKW